MTAHLALLRFIACRMSVRSRMDVKLVFHNLQCIAVTEYKLRKQVSIDMVMQFPFMGDAGFYILR